MAWLEIIQIRTDIGRRHLMEEQLGRLRDDLWTVGAKQAIMVCRGMVDTDYCIHITNNTGEAEPSGSSLGLRLAAAFKDLFSVHHHVWAEMKRTDENDTGKGDA
jgi:hypothetical protein